MIPNPSSGDDRRGFTLIEIMMVVLLIGIMTAIIVPEMKGTYQGALLRSTSRELINACQLAYSRAVSLNQPHRLRVKPRAGEYVVEKRVYLDQQEAYVPLRDVPGGEGSLDRRIRIAFHRPGDLPAGSSGPMNPPSTAADDSETDPDIVLGFYPDGTADAAELVLQDRDGFQIALRVNPTTARVRVAQVERETTDAGAIGGEP